MQSDQSMHSSHTTDFYQIWLIHITGKFLWGGGGGGGRRGRGGVAGFEYNTKIIFSYSSMKTYLLTLAENISCDPSLELSC